MHYAETKHLTLVYLRSPRPDLSNWRPHCLYDMFPKAIFYQQNYLGHKIFLKCDVDKKKSSFFLIATHLIFQPSKLIVRPAHAFLRPKTG